jgi:hypothetical protein
VLSQVRSRPPLGGEPHWLIITGVDYKERKVRSHVERTGCEGK